MIVTIGSEAIKAPALSDNFAISEIKTIIIAVLSNLIKINEIYSY